MRPIVLSTADAARAFVESARSGNRRLALVPTMGALHAGHLSLMREARARAEVAVASIFVNPTQFGPSEDFSRYPRDLEGDLAKCASEGIDAVFAPAPDEMYPAGHQTVVEVTQLQQGLCGARRPGHFRGVATVVTKLFALLRPHLAFFGEKDYQQLQLIRALNRDLFLGVEVVGMPIVREADGLALSSRNRYLSPSEREAALSLSRGLAAAQRLADGRETDAAALEEAARRELVQARVREDYVSLVEPRLLTPVPSAGPGRPARLLVAAWVGNTRLIDNAPVGR